MMRLLLVTTPCVKRLRRYADSWRFGQESCAEELWLPRPANYVLVVIKGGASFVRATSLAPHKYIAPPYFSLHSMTSYHHLHTNLASFSTVPSVLVFRFQYSTCRSYSDQFPAEASRHLLHHYCPIPNVYRFLPFCTCFRFAANRFQIISSWRQASPLGTQYVRRVLL